MTPRVPSYLEKSGRSLWTRVLKVFDLTEPQDLERLAVACCAADRAAEAREAIAADGAIVEDRFGQPKPHPAVDIERHAWTAQLRALREMGLDALEVAPPRPPRTKEYPSAAKA